MVTLAAARAAKDSLRQHLQGQLWLNGIGITRLVSGSYAVRVNIKGPRANAQAFVDCPVVPRVWHGVPLEFVATGDTVAFGSAPLTTQDYGNIAFGAAALYGTFMVGKIAVDSIIEYRKERFDRKGQPPAAVQAKESTMDGIVKVLGMGYGFYLMSQQLPEVLREAQKLLE